MSNLDPFPIRHSFRNYRSTDAQRDFWSGLNVALLAFPQGMAYALIAGLPIEYGVYGSAVAALIGPLFSGSRFIILGPTNATSILLFTTFLGLNFAASEKLALLPVLLLLVGLFLVLGALLRVADLIQYISHSVITGYITAAALLIIANQTRSILGVSFELPPGTTIVGIISLTVQHLNQTDIPSILLSAATVLILVVLNRKFLTFPNIAITLIIASLIAGIINTLPTKAIEGDISSSSLQMLNAIDSSEWSLKIPKIGSAAVGNLAISALVIAFLCILEGASIGKSLAARSGKRFNTNQEMLGMGIANIACSFSGGMPASGSLSRSSLNYNSNATSPFSSIISGLICTFVAALFGGLVAYVPKAALGVVVISIGLSLINRYDINVSLKTTKSDAIVFTTTFLSALLVKLEFGILLGTITSIFLFVRKAAVPELIEYTASKDGDLAPLEKGKSRHDPEVSIVHVEGELFFGAAELFRDQMRRLVEDSNLKVVILKMRNAHHLDSTSALALIELVRNMREIGRYLLVSEAREEVFQVFRNSGLIEVIGSENIFPEDSQNPTLSTAQALRRAKEIVGGKRTRVSIFTKGGKNS
ncbi:MAG: putative sulfate transporter [Candidatus Moanabacter tarae]|uniref:Putative sulfate transporter n=1 Tax=Candidatus Moanibacter tarae TaxID=2200854 RepID=A0A2Z4ACI8_9BACT|nr:MAG: putative sulfate transporter [Candidatus Moanabacter tarae]|tara:strand:- start:19757 stop:21529 length:1773 start_codon:yes stop_codon:yes gene_type:complete